jgi:hypothetical protein
LEITQTSWIDLQDGYLAVQISGVHGYTDEEEAKEYEKRKQND